MTEPAAGAPKPIELQSGPGPALIRAGQRYLLGCLNEEAAEAWTTAIGLALARRGSLDLALYDICGVYIETLGREV